MSTTEKKKFSILLVVFYWPPAGGVSSQRWLKMTKYLAAAGHKVTVIAGTENLFPIIDDSLAIQVPDTIEVHRVNMWDPRFIYSWLSKNSKKRRGAEKEKIDAMLHLKNRSWKQQLMLWIRANFFIPDARAPWIRPAFKKAVQIIKKDDFDFVVSSGPPHSVHIVARKIKKQFRIKWISDFRDPWMDIGYLDKMPMTKWADLKHRRLERAVVRESDGVVLVSDHWKEKYDEFKPNHSMVIYNGFDSPDFGDIEVTVPATFTIGYVGRIDLDRHVPILWDAIEEIRMEDEAFQNDFHFKFVGPIDTAVKDDIDGRSIKSEITYIPFVSHHEALQHMVDSTVLLLVINQHEENAKGRMTSKIFEYLAARRPILMLGPKSSDPAKLLMKTQGGLVAPSNDKHLIKEAIRRLYQDFKNGRYQPNSVNLQSYSRSKLTEQFIEFMHQMERRND